MRYYASISYDGSKFYGFQRLNDYLTVQGELERALGIIDKHLVVVKGAGRTDRGVHAFDQGISFDLINSIPIDNLVKALNRIVNDGICINYIRCVDDEFHARFSARYKVYEYSINLGSYNPIINNYVYNFNRDLDIRIMKKASKLFLGFHSFEAFTSGKRDCYDSVIYKIRFIKKGDFLTIRFIGKSFYRYMVRNIVGCLIDVGLGKISCDDVYNMLNGNGFVKYNTVPANGLYLVNVVY